MADDYVIAIPVYQGVDLMDIAAPYEIFRWMADNWKERQVHVYLAAENVGTVITRDGFPFTPHKIFEQLPKVDLLWVPGGEPDALLMQMRNSNYVKFLQSCSKTAEYVTSVCEGALIAANAGLLDNYEVTTHWAFLDCLKKYPVKVASGHPRYFHDRNRVTGGGISSGLDEALYLVKLIAGEEIAKQVQVTMQYFPCPPVKGTIPSTPACPLEGKIPIC